MKTKNTGYCDHCGKIIPTGDTCAISHLPIDITSENTGGSAVVCADCYVLIMTTEVLSHDSNSKEEADFNNQEFLKGNMK